MSRYLTLDDVYDVLSESLEEYHDGHGGYWGLRKQTEKGVYILDFEPAVEETEMDGPAMEAASFMVTVGRL